MSASSSQYPLEDGTDSSEPNPYLPGVPAEIISTEPRSVLFGPKFCLNIPKTFLIREKVRMNRDNCFKVYDVNNVEYFKVSNPMKTMRGKHVITDTNGEDVAKLKKKLLSLHPTWHLNSGPKLESRLATLVFEFTMLKKKAHAYIYEHPYPHEDDDTKYEHLRPALYIKSDSTGRDFKVFDEMTSEVLAEISKKVAHDSTDVLVEPDNYSVTVNPGVDVLFMISLTLMYEYALSDIEH